MMIGSETFLKAKKEETNYKKMMNGTLKNNTLLSIISLIFFNLR